MKLADQVWAKSYPASLDWEAALPELPLYQILDDAVRDFPAQCCVDFLGKHYSYQTIATLVAQAAQGLQQLGVEQGDRVGLFLPNTPYYVISYFAALKIGATVVNFNPLYADREVEHQIMDAGVKVMVTVDVPSCFDKLHKLIGRTSLAQIVVGRMVDILPPFLSVLYRCVKRKEMSRITYAKTALAPTLTGCVKFSDLLG